MNNRIYLTRVCPTTEEWKSLLARDLTEARASEMESHLENCLVCLAVVDSLTPPLPRGLTDVVRELDRPARTGSLYWRRWADVRLSGEATPDASGGGRKAFELTGAYESRGRIAVGGMGEVYKAWEVALRRDVAIKILPARVRPTPAAVARLKQEAQRLAKLEHPNIVRLYTADERDGVPFFTMELVSGPTLTSSLRSSPPTPRRAAELVKVIAEAVHYAHNLGVFHLDLKPGNILLTPDGVPKVGDFGLSRALDGDPGQARGRAAGTDEYMAPEQWIGDPQSLREQTDVYGLGAILYELLTGRPPFLRSAERAETRRRVLFDEAMFHASHHRGVPSDLKTICLRCLRKQPEDRYATANDVADRLGRFLRGYPVEDCSWARRGLYLVRRRRAMIGGAAVGLLVLAAMLGLFVTSQWRQQLTEARSRFDAGRRWAAEGRVTDGFALMREATHLLPFGERRWRDYFSRGVSAWESRSARELASLARPARVTAAAASRDGRYVLVGDEKGETVLWDRKHNVTRSLIRSDRSRQINAVAFDRNSTLCASGGDDSTINVWDVRSGDIVTTCRLPYIVRCVALLDDGEFFVTGTGDPKTPLKRWKTIRGGAAKEVSVGPPSAELDQIVELSASPECNRFVSVSYVGRCQLWNSLTGACIADLTADVGSLGVGARVRTTFAADGSQLAIAGARLTLHDGRSGERLRVLEAGRWGELYALGFRDDGGLTIIADAGKRAVVRQGDAGHACWDDSPIDKPRNPSEAAMVTAGGLVLSGRGTQTVRLSRPPTMTVLHADLGDADLGLALITMSKDASMVATLCRPTSTPSGRVAPLQLGDRQTAFRSRLQVWDGRSLRPLSKGIDLIEEIVAQSVAVSPRGGKIAVGCLGSTDNDGQATILVGAVADDETLNLSVLGTQASDVMAVAFTVDGKALLTGSAIVPDSVPGELICWSVDERRALWRVAYSAGVIAVHPSPDGAFVALGGSDGLVRILALDRPHAAPVVLPIGGHISGLAYSSDGTKLAVAATSGRVTVFERSGVMMNQRAQFEHPGTTISTLEFGRGDHVLYVKGVEEIYRWDTRVWEPIEPSISFAVKLLDFKLTAGPVAVVAVTKTGNLVRGSVGLSD
jgi:eukaryotic-like serine/threonine-protein kinase